MKWLEACGNIFRVPDLRNRLLFTFALLAVYRVGGFIPTPGVNTQELQRLFEMAQGSALGILNLFSGGQLASLTIFALGVMPYITASIILQLMTVAVPTLERLQKEGELGRRKITQWTRYLTVGIAIVQSFAFAQLVVQQGLAYNPGWGFRMMFILTLTTGTAFVMWLGEQITERGIGNGMSLIIFLGIVVGLPSATQNVYENIFVTQQWSLLAGVVILVSMVAVVGFIVFVERGERRIPVQYARRIVGRRMMGGQQTHLPLKVNAGGVIPVIFASSILSLPQTLSLMFADSPFLSRMLETVRMGEPLYELLYVLAIVFFCFFYVSIIFNPNEVADNMRKYGGFIPGIRSGKPSAEHINDILTKLTLVGGLYLAAVSLLPDLIIFGAKIHHLPLIGDWADATLPRWLLEGLGVNFYFGGTSLLIVVGVSMDFANQIESQMLMRHSEGFTPRTGRIRGRNSFA